MLSSQFFQDYTGAKRDKGLKTYDHMAFSMDDVSSDDSDTALHSDVLEDDCIATLAMEHQDEDAVLIMQFEEAVMDSIQSDSELSAFYSAYQDARKRLAERFRTRGFWPVKGGKGQGKRAPGKGTGKSLAQRIANSKCRICGQIGHWKSECPNKPSASSSNTVPTSFVSVDPVLPELASIPEIQLEDTESSHDMPVLELSAMLGNPTRKYSGAIQNPTEIHLRSKLLQALRTKLLSTKGEPTSESKPAVSEPSQSTMNMNDVHFASAGTVGVVDLGASQTVMGSQQVEELLAQLPNHARQAVRRTPNKLVFRFGNHQTLTSTHSLVFPFHKQQFRIAIVPGNTPFLLSSAFLKQIQAVIDTDEDTIWSKLLKRSLSITRSNKNLLLMDINQLWEQEAFMLSTGSEHTSSIDEAPRSPTEPTSPHLSSQETEANEHSCHPSEPFPSSTSACHVGDIHAEELPQGVEGRGQQDPIRSDPDDDTGRVGNREGQLWGDQERSDLSTGLPGSGLDRLCGVPLRGQERQTGAPQVHPVCQVAHAGGQEGSTTILSTQDEPNRQHQHPTGHLGGSELHGRPCRDQRDAERGDGGSSSIKPTHSFTNGQSGDVSRGNDAPSSSHECQGGGVLSEMQAQEIHEHIAMSQHLLNQEWDFDFEGSNNPHNFVTLGKRFIQQFEKEYQQVKSILSSISHRRLDLLEVMCSDQSELVNQVRAQGGRAERFGKTEGDLSQKEARLKLFKTICMYRPKNLWYSPECGPWSKWNVFNMHRSLDGHADVMVKRAQAIWQISLGIVLFRIQRAEQSHFHAEQPRGSQMLNNPLFKEIREHTQECRFDMCQVGNLRDPLSQLPIQKGPVVCSTSKALHRAIHGKTCTQDHEHQVIEGTTIVNGQRISRSTFSENYPKKFAKQVVKVLLYHHHELPTYAGELDDHDEHPTKRRRLSSKLSSQEIAQKFAMTTWKDVMVMADRMALRVGNTILESGELIELIQRMCPEQQVHHIVLCRGTDRHNGPLRKDPPGTCPWRKRICIRRRHEDIVAEENWENWENLSSRKLRRNGTPARVSLTVFASAKASSASSHAPAQSEDTSSPELPAHEAPQREDDPHAKRHCVRGVEPNRGTEQTQEPPMENEASERETIDLASQKHGPAFLQLPSEKQAWLLKLHRNLGHPSVSKLRVFCQQLQCSEEILKAIQDLKCSTCQETQPPRQARPSAIHDARDFGDMISIDGITWTGQEGQQYHFVHMLDHSTLFHVGMVTKSRDATEAIRAISHGWMQWAGPPGTIVMDAASEFNSEQFLTFLQKHGIKSRTIATDAHWQNSRSERHGKVLQEIITKMDQEEPIKDHNELSNALHMATHTKNQWSRHRGYSPEILVFGKSSRVPGTMTSDDQVASHMHALADTSEGQQFRAELALRESARKAFAHVDNSQVIRRALIHKSHPTQAPYVAGDWVMMWRKRGEADGQWIGPMRVLGQEQTKVVWLTWGTKLYRVAPEHVRPLSAVEEVHHQGSIQSAGPITSVVPPHGGMQYHDLTQTPGVPTSLSNPPTQADLGIPPGSQSEAAENQPESVQEQADNEPHPPSTNANDEQASHGPEEPGDVSQIPVPSDDDELMTIDEQCFHLEEDQVWMFEVPICQADIAKWRQETNPHEMSFLVSAAKRQRSEVRLTQLSSADRSRFEEAKAKEIESWITTGTIARILRNKIPLEKIMRSRWILTWKEIDEGDQGNSPTNPRHKPKARLVVLGYEDPQVASIPRDSPTMSTLTRTLILQYAASNKLTIESFDIQTAFLRGSEQSGRLLGMEPPEELRTRLRLKPNEIVQLLKGAYGRVDAPYLWFMELKKGLEELNFQQSPFDPCLFVLTHPTKGTTEGVLGVHVDDGLCCGTEYFAEKLRMLEAKYPFGSRKSKEFTFTGLKIKQASDYSITVDQTQYVRDIQSIPLSRERRQQVTANINEEEKQQLRAIIGSLQYAAINTRPDLCSRLGQLQGQINCGTVGTLIEANKTLHEAKMFSNTQIRIQAISTDRLRFVAFSDASFASPKNPNSFQGMIIMAADKCIGQNQNSPINPLIWHSRKIQKVTVSTLSAEAMALAGSVDVLSWVRLFWGWLLNTSCAWRSADKTLLQLPEAFSALPPDEEDQVPESHKLSEFLKQLPEDQSSIISTDCKSLYDLVSRTAPPACTEFRTSLQAKLIKEQLALGIQIRWVPSAAQIADCLTKVMDNSIIRTCLAEGRYSLHDEAEILRARSDARTRLQWIKSQNPQGQ